jgi:hypothetical protein
VPPSLRRAKGTTALIYECAHPGGKGDALKAVFPSEEKAERARKFQAGASSVV